MGWQDEDDFRRYLGKGYAFGILQVVSLVQRFGFQEVFRDGWWRVSCHHRPVLLPKRRRITVLIPKGKHEEVIAYSVPLATCNAQPRAPPRSYSAESSGQIFEVFCWRERCSHLDTATTGLEASLQIGASAPTLDRIGRI